jgi:hypothetical protein
MTTRMRIKGALDSLSQSLRSAMAHSHYSRTRGTCPHCTRDTTWAVRPLSGYHRCLECGNDPLDGPRAAQ